jgi:hypothetical protein
MVKYLAGVLTVIAVGVLLVAYGLLAQRAEASLGPDPSQYAFGSRPALNESGPPPLPPDDRQYGPMQMQTPMRASAAQPVRTVQTIDVQEAPVRQAPRRTAVERSPRRDWKKTALMIGGSSAAGAGVGAIFGGKKGALIGAAIGGGASTIFETTRR